MTLALDVVNSAWKPEGDDDPEVPVLAFAEHGHAPLVPGPMIRVPQGTDVSLTLRNLSDSAVTIGGLRPRVGSAVDSIQLPARATRTIRFRLDTAGTYFYWGALGTTASTENRLWLDSQLNGALVVDAPGARTDDHILLFSEWFLPYDDPNQPFEVVSVINGKGWPYTERLTLTLGDSTRFRVINATQLFHPIHLHGFYYRVEARGTWNKDAPIAPRMQPMLNTDLLAPSGTLTLAFAPTTPGNWLLHCHFSFHMDETVTLAGSPRDAASTSAPNRSEHVMSRDGGHHMRGLVVGIQVPSPPGYTPYRASNAREIRLLAQTKRAQFSGSMPAYAFVTQADDKAPKGDSVRIPGPVLELERGKPVRITVVNNLDEPTGVHWHGLEIESFPDGVANWSGVGDHMFKPIAPGDSFVAEFTPPRAGTFPYHSHLNERKQILSGMYGAIIVTDTPRDLAHDHLIVAGGGGPELLPKTESPYALVNGRRAPRLQLTAGETHRLRLVSVHPDWRVSFTLRNDSTTARWRAIAKDGATMPPIQATMRLAHVEMGPGETADFEFTPVKPGRWLMEVSSVEAGWFVPMEITVVAPTPTRNARGARGAR